MKQRDEPLPPAILLGGGSNALSVARSLGRRGVDVYAINSKSEYVRFSRFCRFIHVPAGDDADAAWAKFLLGPESDQLRGAVLLACSDAAIKLIAHHRDELAARFRLDLSDPAAQLRMLSKLSTYEDAEAASVPTPRFWLARSEDELLALRDELRFPLIVKPLFSHVFEERFHKKFVRVHNFDELAAAAAAVNRAGIETMLVEVIPGPDSRLCSYYTYLDEHGEPQFHFTKRVIRRFPCGMGACCYHVTDWNPEVRDLGLKLFRHVGLRGLANVEFKRDPRDGRLKLIECNARFTAANCLVAAAGFDLASYVYNRAAGRPLPEFDEYATGMRLWYPLEDCKAYREQRDQGQLTLSRWVRSLRHAKMLPYFEWTDPLPSIVAEGRRFGRLIARGVRRFVNSPAVESDESSERPEGMPSNDPSFLHTSDYGASLRESSHQPANDAATVSV